MCQLTSVIDRNGRSYGDFYSQGTDRQTEGRTDAISESSYGNMPAQKKKKKKKKISSNLKIKIQYFMYFINICIFYFMHIFYICRQRRLEFEESVIHKIACRKNIDKSRQKYYYPTAF